MVRNPPEAPSATPRPPLRVIIRPYFLRPFPPRGILEVLSVDFLEGGRSYSVASESKPSPARGRCPPELGRGGWSKPASPVDRQGFDLLGGGSSTPNQYVIPAQRCASARCAWAERPSAIRERGPWSRCRAGYALCPQGWLGGHECPGVRPAQPLRRWRLGW